MSKRQAFRFMTLPLKVIFSPFKVFKEIAQNPDLKGFALIVGLIILTGIGVQYTSASKIFLSISDKQEVSSKLYTYSDAYVYVTAFGNYTFKMSQPYIMSYTFIDKTPLMDYGVFWVNTTEALTPANPVVTIANDTFYQTTVDVYQSNSRVGNLTSIAKFDQTEKPKFSALFAKSEEWNLGNFTVNWFMRSSYTYFANRTTTIDLASKTSLSLLESNAARAELGNARSLDSWRLSILSDWSDYGNATIYGGNHTLLTYSGTWLNIVFDANNPRIDPTLVGLAYSSLYNTNLFGGYLLNGVIDAAVAFFFNWVMFTGVLFLITRVLGGGATPWRPFFILIGYAFSVYIIRSIVSVVLISTLPEINFQIASWPPSQAEATLAGDKISATWGPTYVFQAGTYFNLIVEMWFMILGAIALHASREISWSKAAMIAVTAYLLFFTLKIFIGFY